MSSFELCTDPSAAKTGTDSRVTILERPGVETAAPSRLQRMIMRRLDELQGGTITLKLPAGQTLTVGSAAADELSAEVSVRDDRFFRELAFGGSLGAAEAYLQGLWDTDELVALICIFCRNFDRPETIDTFWSRAAMSMRRVIHWMASNTRRGARRNIAAHYDLSNEFFQLFLDPTMMYSSGIFLDEEWDSCAGSGGECGSVSENLQAASLEKIDRACRTLGLQPGDRLIEIGTGWGGLAEHAARQYGCLVTSTTISQRQYEFARSRIAASGLSERVTLLCEDYRDLPSRGERFDHLVSIEMIEAVGHRFLQSYFDTCAWLLKPGGRMLIQAITMPDERYASYCRSVDFIQRYVFPGGHLPSVHTLRTCAAQTGLLGYDTDCEFPKSYALTLRCWRHRFLARLDEVRRLGFDERFIRLWEYYLCYCEAAFLERAVSVGQYAWTRHA